MRTLSVMVVEDHGFQRRMALRLLGDLGVRTLYEAADGAAALGQLEAMARPPDVVMVDLDLPGMDGVELIDVIAQRKLAHSVVLFSALDPALLQTVDTMSRGYGLRVLGNIEKPLTHAKLRAVLAPGAELLPPREHEEPLPITAANVREALGNGHIEAWFQPQIELGNGKPVGAEALARWRMPGGRVVRPLHFIPLIEREGLADALVEHMLASACRSKREWDARGLHLRVSVNVSPATLAEPELADRYQSIVQGEGVNPADVVLELTEHSLLTDGAKVLNLLARLRLKGFGLSIDDFGTGYSSLAQLSQVPFTEIKIDRGFVSGALQHSRRHAVVEASLRLADRLDLVSVGEGVETDEEWQMLAEMGCAVAQGYLIARPVPPDALVDTLAQWRGPLH